MSRWECAITGCGSAFERVEALLAHQVADHAAHDCEICGESVPEGYFAIRHGLREHTRAEYVRFYDGDAAAIRERERVLDDVGDELDPDVLEDLLGDEPVDAVEAGDAAPATTT